MKSTPEYNRIIISDVHFGMRDCKIKSLYFFIKSNKCNHLILNGDIIDTYHIRNINSNDKYAMKLLRLIIKRMNNGMKVTYIRGNHDNFIDNFLKIDIHQIGNLELANEIVIEGINGKVYLVTHGDQFDKDISAWMYKVGSLAYDFLLFVNRVYNAYRLKRNMPYKSISQKIKQRSKMVTNFISKRQDRIIKLCKSKGYDGIITGHTHMPKATQITNSNIAENFIIDYMNSGDWVESKSAIVEKSNGEWGMISYRD